MATPDIKPSQQALQPKSEVVKREEGSLPPAMDSCMPDFRHGIYLAPMVRIGTLPMRLLALAHGADLVWGPEIVDRAILESERVKNSKTGETKYMKDGRQVFSCHALERRYLIFQLGSASPKLAAEAVKLITAHNDVAGVDLNCGCPKPFSTSGGMGANLLTKPELLCDVLTAMREAAPPHVCVTAKIRLLPTQEETLALVEKIVRSRTIRALTVHCRTKDMRPREPALHDRLRDIVKHVRAVAKETGQDVPVVCNGDCFGFMDVNKVQALTGVESVMIARGAEANPSCFGPVRYCVATEVAPKWLQYAVYFDNPFGNTKYCIMQLAFNRTAGGTPEEVCSPLSKRELIAIRSNISQSKTYEELARALNMPWPLPTEQNPLTDLSTMLEGRVMLRSRYLRAMGVQ